MIYNGVESGRFTSGGEKFDRPTVLFAGTVDYLRAHASALLLEETAKRDWDVLFVGRRMSGQLDDLPPHARYHEGDIWDIENTLSKCVATAGILLGRTTIEGWWAGLPGFIYDINSEGVVDGWGEYQPPHQEIMRLFDSSYMADRYEEIYERS